MLRISFDADGTLLGSYKIRLFARDLVNKGYEVWIVTARYSNTNDYCPEFLQKYAKSVNHKDLYEAAKWCGITEDHIHFCNMAPKAEFFRVQASENTHFLWHLDDDPEEINEINASTVTNGISCLKGPNWRLKCMELINRFNGYMQAMYVD